MARMRVHAVLAPAFRPLRRRAIRTPRSGPLREAALPDRSTTLRRTPLFGLAAAIAVLASCADLTGPHPGDPAYDLVITTGELRVELQFQGTPLGEWGVTNVCEYGVTVGGQGMDTWNACSDSGFTFEVQSGEHEVVIRHPQVIDHGEIISWGTFPVASADVTVEPGEQATLVFELSEALGLATGVLEVDGTAPGDRYGVCVIGNLHECGPPGAGGSFAVLGHEAEWANPTVFVFHLSNRMVAARLEPAFETGAIVDLGTVSATTGVLEVRPTYAGTPISELGIPISSLCNVWLSVDRMFGPSICSNPFDGLGTGLRDVRLAVHHFYPDELPPDTVGPDSVTIGQGMTTVWAPDLSSVLGLLSGTIVPPEGEAPHSYRACIDSCVGADEEGRFEMLVRGGSGTLLIRDHTWDVVLEVPFTGVVGETVDLEEIAVAPPAEVTLRLLFRGEVVPAALGSGLCGSLSFFVDDRQHHPWFCDPARFGMAELSLAAGTREIRTDYPWDFTVAELTVELEPGGNHEVDIDLDALGLVSASIRVNGEVPPGDTYVVARDGVSGWVDGVWSALEPALWIPIPEGGTFQFFDHPGPRLSDIRTWQGGVLTSFGYSVIAGQVTIVGSAEGGASGVTEAGDSVTVTPVDSNTGESPVNLMFGTVTGDGHTTLSTSDEGPELPEGTEPGSELVYYWIDSSAEFDEVEICINYGSVTFSDPDNVALYHGQPDGSWVDVTTSHDPSTSTVCGKVSSFSPFVILQNIVPALAPEAALDQLRERVAALGDEGLGVGEVRALLAPLDAAAAALSAGRPGQAVQQLDAFVNQVEAYRRSGRLTAATAAELVDRAEAIVSMLASG